MPFLISADDPDYRTSRSARFRSPTRGVRLEASATGWWDDLCALALVLPDDGAFSHTTAAVVTGIPLPASDPRPFHVTVPGARGSRKALSWHIRDLTGAVETWKGLPVTKPSRTWHDLGALLPVSDLVVAADHLLRRGMATPDQLVDVCGLRGAPRLRKAASLADGRSRSPRESMLRLEMLRRGLPRPELNLDIIEASCWLGCGDFAWPAYRVVVDYDGEHHSDERQRAQDNSTRDDYTDHGWRHVALTKTMLRNMDAAIERVARALRGRGWVPASQY
jgi:hypothetical protein